MLLERTLHLATPAHPALMSGRAGQPTTMHHAMYLYSPKSLSIFPALQGSVLQGGAYRVAEFEHRRPALEYPKNSPINSDA